MSVKKRDNLSISFWIRRFSHLIDPGKRVLDLAAGQGRHTLWFHGRGAQVTALDREIDPLVSLRSSLSHEKERLNIIQADLEDGSPWPLQSVSFDAVVVVNYLYRPLFSSLLDVVAPNGLLLYETFAAGQESLGRPTNPDFLLEPGELLELVSGTLSIIAYEQGMIETESGKAIKQRLAATRSTAPLVLASS